MIFCDNCFRDLELRNVIRNNSKGNVGVCPVCHKKDVTLYDSEKDNYLTPYFEDLLAVFTPEDNLALDYPKDEIRNLVDQIQYHWNVFSSIDKDSQKKIIKAIFSDTFGYSGALFTGRVGIPALFDEKYLKDKSLFGNKTWEEFKTEIKTVNRYHSKLLNSEMFKSFCSFIRKEYRKGDCFYRARISDAKGFAPEEMSAPPAGKSSEGRANAKGVVCLYLANDKQTVLHEVRAGLFDFVTIGKFVLQKDITIVNLRGISEISPFLNEMNFLDYAINKDYLAKIDEDMSKSLRRSDSTLDYVPTQYITDFIKSIEHNGSNEYDGIEYKSTTNSNGFNLAIFDPSLFKCESVEVIEITKLEYDSKPKITN
ncbi:MAG: RES family NAD+ phosphorylase [Spirochaetales bacterium]|nr:RES family NAD+ phosphorylase [Spirochaetales bacterium]